MTPSRPPNAPEAPLRPPRRPARAFYRAAEIAALAGFCAYLCSGSPPSPSFAYRIYRDGAWIATSNTAKYTDVGLAPNTSYVYQVSAVDALGRESPLSAPVTARTLGRAYVPKERATARHWSLYR